MKIIGNRDLFAIEYDFLSDPDKGKAALPEESLSWGCFAIWVNGLNICQYSYNNETEDYVTWYLYPALCWLTHNWAPLLYEERAPVPTEKFVARAIFFEYAKQSFGLMNEEEGTAWYNWGQRHSLRACSNGGIFPDLFIRALGDNIEFSWGNTDIPGMPTNMFFTAPYGSYEVERQQVKEVLSIFLIDATDYLVSQMPESDKLQKLNRNAIKTVNYDISQQLKWMIPAFQNSTSTLETLFEKIKEFIKQAKENFIPAPVLMFGSFSPQIQGSDVDIVINAISSCQDNHPLSEFVKRSPIPNKNQHESGYSLALDFIDDFSERYDMPATIENVIKNLDIYTSQESFSDTEMRGIVMAGKGIKPNIFVNSAHQYNMTDNGRRFTMAHELCHLLFDRQYGHEVGIVSGPWAHAGIEKRANAFAAMLLMPSDIVEEKIECIDDLSCLSEVQTMATELQVSVTALIEHLYNLGAINILVRDKLRKENTMCH